MNNYQKILEFAKNNNGYVTSKDLDTINVNSTFLNNLYKKGELERVGVGIYKLPDASLDEFYVISNSSKYASFSHETALYLHHLSDKLPLVYNVTVPYNYSSSLTNNPDVSLKYVKDEIFNLGLIEMNTDNGLSVRTYDIERTICDIIKDRKDIAIKTTTKALKEYIKRKDKDLIKLIEYARTLNIEDDVSLLIDVLL